MGVECIVAPYEADAQLAYLQKEGIVELVITEDSDMLVFGCKQVITRMLTPVLSHKCVICLCRCCSSWTILATGSLSNYRSLARPTVL